MVYLKSIVTQTVSWFSMSQKIGIYSDVNKYY